ncbi:MAG TPA: hypothetical protein V6C76_17885 [Drouetiella sp.]
MKDAHWIIVFAVILITPFLPVLLRDKCPGCKRRKLNSLETLKVHADDGPQTFSYITFYKCDNCLNLYKRIKSGPLEESTKEEYRLLGEAAVAARNLED